MASVWDQFDAVPTESASVSPTVSAPVKTTTWDNIKNVPAGKRSYKWSEVPSEALQHILPDAANLVSGAVVGIPQAAARFLTDPGGVTEGQKPPGVQLVDAALWAGKGAVGVGKHYLNYLNPEGDFQNAKQAIAEHPVGTLADLSALAAGGAGGLKLLARAGEAGGVTGLAAGATRAAGVADNIANGLNPITMPGRMLSKVPGVNALGSLAQRGIKSGAGFVYNNMLDPTSTWLLENAGDKGIADLRDATQLKNVLQTAAEIVPGDVPTSADIASSVGKAKFSGAADSLMNQYAKDAYNARLEEEYQARQAHLGDFAKTPDVLKQAEEARAAATKPVYRGVRKSLTSGDPELNKILSVPAFQTALSNAKNISGNYMERFKVGEDLPGKEVQGYSSSLSPDQSWSAAFNPTENTFSKFTLPNEYAGYPGSSIQRMKFTLDKMISHPEEFSIDQAQVGSIRDVRAKFVNWADKKVPNFKRANAIYQEMSKPITDMETGQFLQGRLAKGGQSFLDAIQEAPTSIKNVSADTPHEVVTDLLSTPDAMDRVNRVADSVRRSIRTAEHAGGGGEMPANFATIPLPGRISHVANILMSKLGGTLSRQEYIRLASKLVDPKATAQALQYALGRQAKAQELLSNTRAVGNALVRPPAAGVYNALSPQNQNNNALGGP